MLRSFPDDITAVKESCLLLLVMLKDKQRHGWEEEACGPLLAIVNGGTEYPDPVCMACATLAAIAETGTMEASVLLPARITYVLRRFVGDVNVLHAVCRLLGSLTARGVPHGASVRKALRSSSSCIPLLLAARAAHEHNHS